MTDALPLPAPIGEDLLGAFRAVRSSDRKWAAEHSPAEIVAAHLWRY